jgi:hypothetical protein
VILFGSGFVAGAVTMLTFVHFAVIRKLQARITYIEGQFRRRFAQIV